MNVADGELYAISWAVKCLEHLDTDARRRVLDYLYARYVTSPEAPHPLVKSDSIAPQAGEEPHAILDEMSRLREEVKSAVAEFTTHINPATDHIGRRIRIFEQGKEILKSDRGLYGEADNPLLNMLDAPITKWTPPINAIEVPDIKGRIDKIVPEQAKPAAFCFERVEDGQPAEQDPPPWPHFIVREQMGRRWFIVDRNVMLPNEVEHLQMLRRELNFQEHKELPAYYQPLYTFHETEDGGKFVLSKGYVEKWSNP